MLVRRVNNRMPDLGNVIDNFLVGIFQFTIFWSEQCSRSER